MPRVPHAISSDRWLVAGFLVLAMIMAFAMFAVGLANIPVSTDESIVALQAKHILTPPTDPDIRESIQPQPLFHRFPLLFMAQPYLFPIEAYIAAIPQLFLPHNTFGARLVPFGLSLAALVFSFLIVRNFGRCRDTWPGLLLLSFPSAYVLMMQFGYALPGYPSHLFFIALDIWFLQQYAKHPHPLVAAACGMICAAALAGQFMAAPLLVMTATLLLLTGRGWWRLVDTVIFSTLAASGWVPIALAKRLCPGAHDAVAGTWSLADAWQRLWSPALDFVLPVASGIKTTVFPDNTRLLDPLPVLSNIWPYCWLFFLLVAVTLLLARLIRDKFNPTGDVRLVAAIYPGLAIAAILLFILSRRSHSHTYRYLLNAAWAFPFIIAYIYSEIRYRLVRIPLAILAVLLAGFNLFVIASLMREWSQPRFAADEASLYDTTPTIEYLNANGIDRVYAGYHLAYRLNYVTDEHIIAGQPYNERFFGWPAPYTLAVDQDENVAYVLAPRFSLTADIFKADMEAMGVSMKIVKAGDLTICHDFRPPENQRGDWLRPAGLRVHTSHNPDECERMIDGHYDWRWRSRQAQSTNMWVQLEWSSPIQLTGVTMFYNYYHHDRANAISLSALDKTGHWQPISKPIPADMDDHEFDNGRPLYGNQFQHIDIADVMTRALRIDIVEPNSGRDWTIGEIRLRGIMPSPK